MKKISNFLTRIVMVILIISMILLCPFSTYSMANPEFSESMDATVELIDSTLAKQLYENVEYISEKELLNQENYLPKDGLSVLYGSNLDTSTIKKFLKEPSDNKKNLDSAMNLKTESGERTNTYMVMYLQNDELGDVKFFSVSYSEEVDLRVIENYVSTQLSNTNMDQEVKSYINGEIENQTSALYGDLNASAKGVSSMYVCKRVKDTNSYIDNYKKGYTSSFPVIVYQKDITYEAYFIPDEIDDSDSYILFASVYITPGNAIPSTSDDIYNDQYGNRIKIRGAKTEFQNLFPEDGDNFIRMSPNTSIADVSEDKIDCTISYNGEAVSVQFSITPPQKAKIAMNTFFDSYGTSYVEFMANSNKRIADKQFFYATAIYMESAGNYLSTRIATGITYRFSQYQAIALESEDRVAGSGRDIEYERK